MRRRHWLLCVAGSGTLAGCGFKLRGAPSFAFSRVYLISDTPLAQELRRDLESGGAVQVLRPPARPDQAEVVLELLREERARVVAGRGPAGQVRELQLRITLKFRVRTPRGADLIPETELVQNRDISFNETQVLAKEAEEALLFRDMQSDLVRQLMRRLAAIRSL